MTHPTILVVDDEADIRLLMQDILADEGYQVLLAANSTEALGHVTTGLPHAVILDIWLQGSELDGLAILERIKEQYPDLPVIIISGHGNIETAIAAIRLGAYDYIEKPFKEEKLVVTLVRALETVALKRENSELKRHVPAPSKLIGKSPAITQLRHMIQKVAGNDSRIFLKGQTGTGKEIVAREIHQHSLRAEQPFIIANTTTCSFDLLEQLLTEGNPFPEPEEPHLLQRAEGGTIYFDEITELSPALQGKLLRFLQHKRYYSKQTGKEGREIDIRIIAGTSRPIEIYIEQDRFRQDLFYRLHVVPIQVPCLKDRKGDIPMLCDYYADQIAQFTGLARRSFTEDALTALEAYHWPGNIKQLRNAIEWAMLMAPKDQKEPISAAMLPPEITQLDTDSDEDFLQTLLALPLRESREAFETFYLKAEIKRFEGNISKTAEFIGMERSALHRKLKSLNIDLSQADADTATASDNSTATAAATHD